MSNLRLDPAEYALLVKQVLSRDEWRCRSCFSRNNLYVHHVIFRSQQGPDEMCNLITLCSSCHDGVHKDVKDGQYGLTIVKKEIPIRCEDGTWRSESEWKFIRRHGWRPQ